jgi:hypothetical protein
MTTPVAAGTSPTSFPWTDCDQRIYFVAATDAAIHELGYNGPNQTECLADLEPAAASAPAGTAPIVITPKARKGHVHVRITIRWSWLGMRTTVHRVRFIKLPHSASVLVTCAGRGCPKRRWSARTRRAAKLQNALKGKVFRAGDRLLITISMPREISQRARVQFRRNRRPLTKLL